MLADPRWLSPVWAGRRRCGCMGGVLFSVCHFLTHQTFFSSRKDHEKAEFEVHEVYAVDVLVSSGEGKVSRVLPARRSPCTWLGLSTAGGADSPIRVGSRCFSLGVAFSIKKKSGQTFTISVLARAVLWRRSCCSAPFPLGSVRVFRRRTLGRELRFTKGTPPSSTA